MNKTAIVIGATGLVGSHIVKQLCEDNNYSEIKIFTRKSLNLSNPKIKEFIVDFENFESFSENITGDELFSAMGTTLKKAGSKENQYKVDYTFQYKTAEIAGKNGVKKYLLVSSVGANERSMIFYSKIKGKLENEVMKLNFQNVLIFRPSGLLGDRTEKRSGEEFGIKFMGFFVKIIPPLRKYRPIHVEIVAKGMIKSTYRNYTEKNIIIESHQILEI
jgi:uncharacterized protein YbjT (DUF2867 family)